MLTFTTPDRAPESVIEGAKPIEFELDGVPLVAYPPTPEAFLLYLNAMAENRDMTESAAGLIDFVHGLLDDDGMAHIEARLMDRKDPFGLEDLNKMLASFMEEWTARPTTPPSGSGSSRSTAGRSSTARPRSRASASRA